MAALPRRRGQLMLSATCTRGGSSRCRFAALRFHPELRYREGSAVRRFPALVAAVTGDPGDGNAGAITGVQRTWLDPRSARQGGRRDPAQGPRPHSRTRRALRRALRRRCARRRGGHRDCALAHRCRAGDRARPPRSRPAASAPSRRRPASRGSSSPATTTRTARSRPSASPGAARGSASPSRSSCPPATTSTTTWSTSARRRCARASRPCSARLPALPPGRPPSPDTGPVEEKKSEGSGKPTRREEGVHERRHQP